MPNKKDHSHDSKGCTSAADSYSPSEKEVLNGRKVLDILEKIEGIGYTVLRDDLFLVEEPELGLEITIDAEENVICLFAPVCDVKHLERHVPGWQEKLLRLNNGLLHGAFTLHEDKVFMRENLAAENLDPNELEDALCAMFAGILRHSRALKLN